MARLLVARLLLLLPLPLLLLLTCSYHNNYYNYYNNYHYYHYHHYYHCNVVTTTHYGVPPRSARGRAAPLPRAAALSAPGTSGVRREQVVVRGGMDMDTGMDTGMGIWPQSVVRRLHAGSSSTSRAVTAAAATTATTTTITATITTTYLPLPLHWRASAFADGPGGGPRARAARLDASEAA